MRRRSTDGCRPVDDSRRLGMPRRRSIAATIWSLMASASRSFRFGWLIQLRSYYAGVDSRADRNAGMSMTGAVVGLTRTLCRSRTLTRVVAAIGLALWLHPSALTQSPAKPPARIVSLMPATTEMLFAVGAGDRGGGGQQLRPLPAGGRKDPAGRRAARSRRRAHSGAAAGSGRRLSQPDRPARTARARADTGVRLRARRPCRRNGHTARAGRASRRRGPSQHACRGHRAPDRRRPGSAMPPGAGRRR